jgi:plasmid maintenance system antidote protein VapI
LQGQAYELSQNGLTIAQVAEKLGVENDAANALINAGRDVFHQRMQEHLRRNKTKTTDE